MPKNMMTIPEISGAFKEMGFSKRVFRHSAVKVGKSKCVGEDQPDE